MKYSCVPLGELVTISGGGTPSRNNDAYWGGSIPWATVKDLKDITLSSTQETITVEGLRDSASNLIPAGSVIVATRMGLGKVAMNTIDVTINQDLKAFSCSAGLDPRYLMYYLLVNASHLDSMGKGATVKGITLDVLKDLSIPLPPLPEQKRIAAILDKADSIRCKRQEAVRLTEELLRSVFLDMFGDPVTNPKGWKTSAFSDACETRLGKMLDAKQQTGEYLRPYLRNSNVQWDRIETSDLEQMDFDEKDRKTFTLRNGDVLICEGGEVGRAAIWRNQLIECYFQKAIHRARPNQSLALPEYVMFWLWFMSKNGGFKDHVTSATIAHLTGEKLKEIQMVLPPLTMQHQFLKIYNSYSSLKSGITKHQMTSDTLFNSLLQRAFKGKL